MAQVNITLATYKRLTEKAWQGQVVQLAKMLGWKVFHPFLSIHSERGFPDITMVRERVLFVEIKAQNGKLSPHQEDWIAALALAGAEVRVWRPSDFDEVVRVLSKRVA